MARIQCKGCDYKPSEHDSLEGYCMTCAAKKIKQAEQLQAEVEILRKVSAKSAKLIITIVNLKAEIEALKGGGQDGR